MKTTTKYRTRGWVLAGAFSLLALGTAQAAPPGNGDPEICDNGIDDDEDRKVDCDDRDCRDDPACNDGGGGGGDAAYRVASSLPGGYGTGLNDSATRVSGVSTVGEDVLAECTLTLIHATVWDLDATGAVTGTHDLPNPLGARDHGEAGDLNDNGLVVGSGYSYADPAFPCGTVHRQPMAWRESGGVWAAEFLPIGANGLKGDAHGVNNNDWIVGWFRGDGNGDGVADSSDPADPLTIAVWIPDATEPSGWRTESLPGPPGTVAGRARAVNDSGRVVGNVRRDDGAGGEYEQAMAWDRDAATGTWSYSELSTLGGEDAWALAVSASGEAVGWADTGIVETYGRGWRQRTIERVHAVRWVQDAASGTWLAPEDLGTIQGPSSSATGVDANGDIAGNSTVRDDASGERFTTVWSDGVPSRLDEQTDGNWTFEVRSGIDTVDTAGDGWVLTRGFQGGSSDAEWLVVVPNTP